MCTGEGEERGERGQRRVREGEGEHEMGRGRERDCAQGRASKG